VITVAPLDPLAAAVYIALAGVVLVATLRRPADAIVALVAAAPFAYTHAVGSTTITFEKVALLAAIIGIALRLARPERSNAMRCGVEGLRVTWGGALRLIGLAILAVLLCTALSIANAHDRGTTLREILKAFEYLLTFGVAAVAWSLDPDVRRLRTTLVLVCAAVCVLALAQEITGAPSGIWFNGKAFPRIAGPLEGPNQLAGYLGTVLPFVVVFALESGAWTTLAVSALGAATLVLTLSRSGVVAGFIALGIVIALRERHRAATLGALVVGIVASVLVLIGWHVSAVGERFVSFGEVEEPGGVGTRRILWRAAIELWQTHPLLGVGAGNFELLLPRVAPAGIKTHANSWYLQSLVEGGLPLLAATLALVWASIAPFRRALRNDLCLAAFAASVAFALHGIFDLLIFFPKVAATWFVVLGIAAIEAERTS
jgi:O-antigen ligase